MKAFDWILLVVSTLWFLFNILRLWAMLESFEVKYQKRHVVISWPFFIPVFIWLFIAYRVGG